MSVTLSDIKAAAARIGSHVHRTEVRTCETFNRMAGDKQLFFKCEMWQKTGSFKARGDIQLLNVRHKIVHKGHGVFCLIFVN